MINPNRRHFVQLAGAGIAGLLGMTQSRAAAVNSDSATTTDNIACESLLSHRLRPLMGSQKQALCDNFAEQVLLLVNTASRCGFTGQFEDLEKLHQRYAKQNFQVLGFPSGDFRQELNSEEEVAKFCEINYGVTFPMFEKIRVTGASAHPLYQDLARMTGTAPRWNFNKYLISRNALSVSHFDSGVEPLSPRLIQAIEELL